jgi:hypothetical protein
VTRKIWWFPLAGFALISLATPWPAHSAEFDYKIHPGSLCQPSNGTEAVFFIRGPGFIYHTNVTAEQPFTVTCPFIRDRVPHQGPTAPDERTRLDVGVWLNGTTGHRIECTFHSEREDGAGVFVETKFTTDPTQDTQALFWDVKPENTAIDGTYSIVCQLPAYVFLLRYIIGEFDSTDVGGF